MLKNWHFIFNIQSIYILSAFPPAIPIFTNLLLTIFFLLIFLSYFHSDTSIGTYMDIGIGIDQIIDLFSIWYTTAVWSLLFIMIYNETNFETSHCLYTITYFLFQVI